MTGAYASPAEELDALLGEDLAAARAREASRFDSVATPFERSLVLFGAGNLGRKTLRGLRKLGIEPLAFANNNASQWGANVDGLPVLSPAEAAARYARRAAFVMTIWRGEGTDTM